MIDDEIGRALAFTRLVQERASTRVEPWTWGSALYNDTIPQRYYSNLVRVERSLAGSGAADLTREADRALAAFGHRVIQVDDEGEAERIAPELESFGYKAERSVLMSLHRDPDRAPDLQAVQEVSFEEARGFLTAIYRRDLVSEDPRLAERFAGFRRVVQQAMNGRFFAQRVDGEIAGLCELYVVEDIAQVEHVDTLEPFRGRGIARNVVLCVVHEARAAGAGMILIDADRDDWPLTLYRRFGFDEIVRTWAFLKEPTRSAD